MKTDQRQWTEATGWTSERTIPPLENAQLVLAFGATSIFKNPRYDAKYLLHDRNNTFIENKILKIFLKNKI